MIRTRHENLMKPPFIVSQKSVMRDTGRQVAFELLTPQFKWNAHKVKINGAVAIGDDAIVVDALTFALPKGAVLDFGAADTVTITLSGNEAIGQTDIGVTALTGPIPSGAILKSGAGEYMTLTAPAAAGATSLTVEALEVAWESGDTATYQGGRRLAILTETGEVGETNLTTENINFAIADDSEAWYGGNGGYVPAGTEMDLLSDGRVLPSVIGTSAVTCYGLIETAADENQKSDALSGYGMIIQGQIYENLLPSAIAAGTTTISSTHKTELLARGGAWIFLQYSDNTNS